jgi:hypothetical protein
MGRHSTCHEHRPGREETADLTPVRRQQHPADSTARERLRELMLAGPGLTSHAEVCTIAHSLPRCGLAGAWGRADCESQTEGSRVGGLSDAAMVVPMRQEPLRVAIVGGGIGGAAAAHALLRRGIAVGLYQEAPGLSEVGAGVALQPNGIRMLRQLGLESELLPWGARWSDPQFRRPDGSYIASMWPPGWAMPLRSMACIAPTCWPCSWIGCRPTSSPPTTDASPSPRMNMRHHSRLPTADAWLPMLSSRPTAFILSFRPMWPPRPRRYPEEAAAWRGLLEAFTSRAGRRGSGATNRGSR